MSIDLMVPVLDQYAQSDARQESNPLLLIITHLDRKRFLIPRDERGG